MQVANHLDVSVLWTLLEEPSTRKEPRIKTTKKTSALACRNRHLSINGILTITTLSGTNLRFYPEGGFVRSSWRILSYWHVLAVIACSYSLVLRPGVTRAETEHQRPTSRGSESRPD